MLQPKLKDISPQSATIYRLLQTSSQMSAADIAKKLDILPHAVYRAIKPLLTMDLVENSNTYPVRYQAKHSDYALDAYVNNAREQFVQSFFVSNLVGSSTTAAKTGLPTTFVKDRQDLLDQSNADMNHAKNEVVMIVSGLIAPAETILAYKRAAERGVKIRIIVQNLNETNKDMLRNWKKLGVEVRYYPLIEARILLFDNNIVYFTSYNPAEKEAGIGVRFAYPPMAMMMNELFEKRWELAEEIN